jgi:hypothetical protein
MFCQGLLYQIVYLMDVFVEENASVETCIIYHLQRSYALLKNLCSAGEHISVLGMSKF